MLTVLFLNSVDLRRFFTSNQSNNRGSSPNTHQQRENVGASEGQVQRNTTESRDAEQRQQAFVESAIAGLEQDVEDAEGIFKALVGYYLLVRSRTTLEKQKYDNLFTITN